MTAPHHWPVDWECLPNPTDTSRAELQESIDTAVGVLWALTGRRFGIWRATVYPCPPGTAGLRTTTCSTVACDRAGSILLPGPVNKLLAFTVDGTDIALDSLLLDGDRIYRRDGQPWPDQNLTRHPTQSGTWSITYLGGITPPAGAAHAVGALAREFHAACTGGKCALPRRTTQVQRQGVTVSMVDPSDIYDTGATGITEVDLWIRAHNPHRQSQPATIWSPDQAVW